MDEIIGRGPQYAQLFWWGCHVGDHRAWAWLDGPGREAVLEEALPPVLRARALCTASHASTDRSSATGTTRTMTPAGDAPFCPAPPGPAILRRRGRDRLAAACRSRREVR